MNKNLTYTQVIKKYFSKFQDSYFIIGGHSCAYNLSKFNLEFRSTKDFDVVLVSSPINESFYKNLYKFIKDGGYRNNYTNEKKNSYRFQNPTKIGFPEIFELFCEDGIYSQSIDKHLAKLNISETNNTLSAIVLNKEVYQFALNNTVLNDGIRFLNLMGCVVLKIYAYYQNKKLFKKKKIKIDESSKHLNDVINILIHTPESGIIKPKNLSGILLKNVNAFINDVKLDKFKQQLNVSNRNIGTAEFVNLLNKIK